MRNSDEIIIKSTGTSYVIGNDLVNDLNNTAHYMPLINTSTRYIDHRFQNQEIEIESLWRDTQLEDKTQDAINYETYKTATKFLKSLPIDIQTPPEIGIMPNGQITLEWQTVRGDITIVFRGGSIHYGQRLNTGTKRTSFEKWSGTISEDFLEKINQII